MLVEVLKLPDDVAVPIDLHRDAALEDEGRRIAGELLDNGEEIAIGEHAGVPHRPLAVRVDEAPRVDLFAHHVDEVDAVTFDGGEHGEAIERLVRIPALEAGTPAALAVLLERTNEAGDIGLIRLRGDGGRASIAAVAAAAGRRDREPGGADRDAARCADEPSP